MGYAIGQKGEETDGTQTGLPNQTHRQRARRIAAHCKHRCVFGAGAAAGADVAVERQRQTDTEIAQLHGVRPLTVATTRRRWVEEKRLTDKAKPGREKKLDGKQEAFLVAADLSKRYRKVVQKMFRLT